ncbi:MAG TPA: succinyl-diaminopimelate desuccinylase [Bauldia sp.]|nr:succinyl-diaminopimelate desuccinylase [Bauldia sp.]
MSAGAADPVGILGRLIACPSVTPDDAGAFDYVVSLLGGAGWRTERITFSDPGTPDVANLIATRGEGAPHLAFSGHVDVVPPGDPARWSRPPFSGAVADGYVHGRGAVDMKGGIAAFIAAAVPFAEGRGGRPGTVTLLLTADEEGPSVNGTAKLLDHALKKGMRFDAALVGEPTSRASLGDTVKIGRRGSLSLVLSVSGRQGHAAYPHLADNPVPKIVRLLHRLISIRLDDGSADFPPSNLEVTSVDVGNPASNVIPAEATARFNIRFNDRWSASRLKEFIRAELDGVAGGGPYKLKVAHESESFLTRSDRLIVPLAAAIREVTGLEPELSTSGGTSDARFFKGICPAIEFGLVGDTMHKIDERVAIADLLALTRIYRGFLDRFFDGSA